MKRQELLLVFLSCLGALEITEANEWTQRQLALGLYEQHSELFRDNTNLTLNNVHLLQSTPSLGFQFANDWENIVKDLKREEKASPSTQCLQHLAALVAGYGQQNLIAYKYFDSWGKIPAGILKGHLYELGNFDECLAVKQEMYGDSILQGKYCFAELPFGKVLAPTPQANLLKLNIAVCLPAVCTARQFDAFYRTLLKRKLNIDLSSTSPIVNEKTCTVLEKPPLSSLDWFAVAVFGILGVLMLLSTLYEYLSKTQHSILSAFSMRQNLRTLLQVKLSVKNPNVLPCLNGIRCMSLLWIVCGHTFIYLFGAPNINSFDILAWGRTAYSMLFQLSPFGVDSFFFLSGLLVAFVGLREIERNNGKLNVFKMYLHRIWRLTPMLALVLLFTATLTKFLSNAPRWYTIRAVSEPCKDNWWKTLLYVQNYVNVEERCLPHAWYLAVDMQLYIVSPIFLLLMFKWQRKGVAAVAGVGLLLVACLFSLIMVRDYSFHTKGLGLADPEALNRTYYATHTRCSPWFVGLLLGYLLHRTRHTRVQMSKLLVSAGWLLSFALLATVLFAFYPKARNGLDTSTVEEAFYWSSARVAWPLGLSWIVFACSNGYGGIVNDFLSSPLWQPLARLSFSIYLWHMEVVQFNAGRLKTNSYFSDYDVTLRFWANFGWAVLVATIIHLALEAPFVRIEQVFWRKPKELNGAE